MPTPQAASPRARDEPRSLVRTSDVLDQGESVEDERTGGECGGGADTPHSRHMEGHEMGWSRGSHKPDEVACDAYGQPQKNAPIEERYYHSQCFYHCGLRLAAQ
jgi:hypothetical protein